MARYSPRPIAAAGGQWVEGIFEEVDDKQFFIVGDTPCKKCYCCHAREEQKGILNHNVFSVFALPCGFKFRFVIDLKLCQLDICYDLFLFNCDTCCFILCLQFLNFKNPLYNLWANVRPFNAGFGDLRLRKFLVVARFSWIGGCHLQFPQ